MFFFNWSAAPLERSGLLDVTPVCPDCTCASTSWFPYIRRSVMPYFVYVKFLYDEVKKVTTSKNVKAFNPSHVDDFEPGCTYSVYWDGDDKTRGGYYDAELLHMTESKDDMDDFIADQRHRLASKKKAQQQHVFKKVKKARAAAKSAVMENLLNDLSGGKDKQLREEVTELKIENARLRKLNMRLQEELLHYISKRRDSYDGKTQNSGSKRTAAFEPHVDKKQHGEAPDSCGKRTAASEPHFDKKQHEQPPRTCAPVELTEDQWDQDYSASVGNLQGLSPGPLEKPALPECATLPPLRIDGQETVAAGTAALLNDDGCSSTEPASALCQEGGTYATFSYTEDCKMHLTNGVFISKVAYETLMGITRDSHFVKRAASAIWSVEVLAQRSFTGTLSNRFLAEGGEKAPQKPLTPHKVETLRAFFNHYASRRGYTEEETATASKKIRLWLSQKTSELRRSSAKPAVVRSLSPTLTDTTGGPK
ncbi:uncharacterized protein LOC135393966 isoform X2 [Ornithodoros turicata]|uniref:uncharacterized protein LOC135393966 isoform X2 n=1 Tax=Ornithodoros turicata TaxID=34597 RepID=UPI0031390EC9